MENDANPAVRNIYTDANNGSTKALRILHERANAKKTLSGRTVAQTAVYLNCVNVLRHIMQERVRDVYDVDDDGMTLLHIAVWFGYIASVRILVEEYSVHVLLLLDSRDKIGRTSLYAAVSRGHAAIVGYLLSKGADPTIPNITGTTPLQATLVSKRFDIADILIGHGVDVNYIYNGRDARRGGTLLHDAVRKGNVPVVEYLLQKGADTTITDATGVTPLQTVLVNKRFDVADILIGHGVDVNYICTDGVTLLHIAIRNKRDDIAGYLVTKGADINLGDIHGISPVHLCAGIRLHPNNTFNIDEHEDDNEYALKVVFVSEDAWRIITTINCLGIKAGSSGNIAIHVLAKTTGLKNYDSIVKDLVMKCGMDVNAMNRYGYTPLHMAALHGNTPVTKALIANGAEAWRETWYPGPSPSSVARGRSNYELTRLISECENKQQRERKARR